MVDVHTFSSFLPPDTADDDAPEEDDCEILPGVTISETKFAPVSFSRLLLGPTTFDDSAKDEEPFTGGYGTGSLLFFMLDELEVSTEGFHTAYC